MMEEMVYALFLVGMVDKSAHALQKLVNSRIRLIIFPEKSGKVIAAFPTPPDDVLFWLERVESSIITEFLLTK